MSVSALYANQSLIGSTILATTAFIGQTFNFFDLNDFYTQLIFGAVTFSYCLPVVCDKFLPAMFGLCPVMHHFRNFNFAQEDIPNLNGKTIIITGANCGLGFWSTFYLIKNGCTVIMACRNKSKASAAREKILKSIPGCEEKLQIMSLDLNDLGSVRNFANEIKKKFSTIDVLMCNAGIMASPFRLSNNGIEQQFAVNHLSHFYLSNLLMETIQKSTDPRIIFLSSSAMFSNKRVPVSAKELNDSKSNKFKSSWIRYANSKLLNMISVKQLAKRYPNVHINAVHPGLVATELERHFDDKLGSTLSTLKGMLRKLGLIWWTPELACLTQLYAAVSPEIVKKNISGKLFGPIGRFMRPHKRVHDEKLQNQIWNLSMQFVENFENGKEVSVAG